LFWICIHVPILAQFEGQHFPEADRMNVADHHERTFYDLKGPVKTANQKLYQYKKRRWWSIRKKKALIQHDLIAKTYSLVYNEQGNLLSSQEMISDVDFQFNGNEMIQEEFLYEYTRENQIKTIRVRRKNAIRFDSVFYSPTQLPVRSVSYDFYGALANVTEYTYYDDQQIKKRVHHFYGNILNEESFTYNDSTYSVSAKRFYPSGDYATEKRIHLLEGQLLYHEVKYPEGPHSKVVYQRDNEGRLKAYEKKEWNQDGLLVKDQLKKYAYNQSGQLIEIKVYGHRENAQKQYLTYQLNRSYDERDLLIKEVVIYLNEGGEATNQVLKTLVYDQQGHLVLSQQKSTDQNGNPVSNEWHYMYDGYGNWISKMIFINGAHHYTVERIITYYE